MSVDGGMNVKGYKEDKACLCAHPEECRGLTAAFVLLKDPRKGFVKLPNWKEDPPTQYYVERNQQRASYLRYLLPGHPAHEPTPSKYIALHHFHPKVTQRFLDKRQKEIPKTITDMEMTHLGMELNDADRVLDEYGFPTGEYIFVPNYEVQKVKEDLKRMILINRLFHEAVNEAREEQEEHLKQTREREEAADREKLEDREAAARADRRPDEKVPAMELLLPSPLETYREAPDDERRRMLHAQLEKWEHERRSDYEVLLESNSATWRGSIDFLEDGVREIARAERLVLGAAMADKLFSEAMHAISHDSFLDDEGNAVTDIRRQNKLMGQREDEWMPTDMLYSVVEEKTRLGAKFGDNAEWGMSEIGTELTVFREEMEAEVAGIAKMGDSLLKEMEASEKEVQTAWDALHAIVMSETMEAPPIISPTASHGSEENDETGSEQEAQDEDAVGSVDSAGDEERESNDVEPDSEVVASPIVEKEFQNEDDSTGAPSTGEDALSPLSQATPKQGRGLGLLKSLSGLSRQSISPATASSLASAATAHFSPVRTSLRKISQVKDVWAREALYRVAALHQAKLCHTCTGLLSKMSDAVKEIELERSVKLHAMLLDFLPRERRLFIGLPAVPKPVIDKLMTFRENESKMGEYIDESLHKRSRIILRIDNDQRSSFLNRARCKAPDLTVKADKPLEGEAFDTDINRYASVVERRVAAKVWKTTLAVVTADYYLHLFDAEEDSAISVGMSAEEAYEKMLPNHGFPTSENPNLGPRTAKVLKDLTPTETINLMNSSAQATVVGDDQQVVEVTETVPGRILEKSTRRIVLKVEDDDTAAMWEDILERRPKDETASDGLKAMLSV